MPGSDEWTVQFVTSDGRITRVARCAHCSELIEWVGGSWWIYGTCRSVCPKSPGGYHDCGELEPLPDLTDVRAVDRWLRSMD